MEVVPASILSLGVEAGFRLKNFRLRVDPQPDGTGNEIFIRFALGFGRSQGTGGPE
jgi:hypothetical protein